MKINNKKLFIIFIIIVLFLIIYIIYKKYKNNNYNFNKLKELKFIHITKNAGTTIEDLAYKNNINWGKYDKEYTNSKNNIINNNGWHFFFPQINKELKLKYDWFMVVRNPYDRIISEYNYYVPALIRENFKFTKDNINNFIINRINNRSEKGEHYSEQYKYLDNDKNIKIHVLKYENLNEEFNKLMKLYNINIKLDEKNILNISKKHISFKDLLPKVIKLINDVYKKDFKIFNYEMINL